MGKVDQDLKKITRVYRSCGSHVDVFADKCLTWCWLRLEADKWSMIWVYEGLCSCKITLKTWAVELLSSYVVSHAEPNISASEKYFQIEILSPPHTTPPERLLFLSGAGTPAIFHI